MNFQTARCLKHPSEKVVGVCGSCLIDRLAFLASNVEPGFGLSPTTAIQPSSSDLHTGNSRFDTLKVLESNNVDVRRVESEPKQKWRSRSLCERGDVRLSLAPASSNGVASDGQSSRNLSNNKVTLRALFELDDLERRQKEKANFLPTLDLEAAVSKSAESCQDVGFTFKEAPCKISKDTISGEAAEVNADDASPRNSVCGAVCPASHGGRHAFWWATPRWRRKARHPKVERKERSAVAAEIQSKSEGEEAGVKISAARRTQALDRPRGEATGRPFWDWRGSKPTDSPVAGIGVTERAEGQLAERKSGNRSSEAVKGLQRRRLSTEAATTTTAEDGAGEEVLPNHASPEHFRRRNYRSASCNAASSWLGTDYRTWEAYYSVPEKMKPPATMFHRDYSRHGDRGYLDRMRTVRISPAIAEQSSLLRFYLTPLGAGSSRRKFSCRAPARPSTRSPWSFFSSR